MASLARRQAWHADGGIEIEESCTTLFFMKLHFGPIRECGLKNHRYIICLCAIDVTVLPQY